MPPSLHLASPRVGEEHPTAVPEAPPVLSQAPGGLSCRCPLRAAPTQAAECELGLQEHLDLQAGRHLGSCLVCPHLGGTQRSLPHGRLPWARLRHPGAARERAPLAWSLGSNGPWAEAPLGGSDEGVGAHLSSARPGPSLRTSLPAPAPGVWLLGSGTQETSGSQPGVGGLLPLQPLWVLFFRSITEWQP